jgi:hypothetical protein
MKRNIRLMTITAVMAMVAMIMVSTAHAKDVMIEKEISSIVEKTDKNGDRFKILVIKIPKTLNGIKYMSPLPIMSFADTIDMTDHLAEGQSVKMIVNISKFQGRDSAVLRAVVE